MDGRTPDEIILEFFSYRRSSRDTLAEFLAHYDRLWYAANRHGITAGEGIDRLIPLLPEEWQAWAYSIIPRHVGHNFWNEEYVYVSFGGFVGEIITRYLIERAAPPAPENLPPYPIPMDDPIPHEAPMNFENELVLEHDAVIPLDPQLQFDPEVLLSPPNSPIVDIVPYEPEAEPMGIIGDEAAHDQYEHAAPAQNGRYLMFNGVLDNGHHGEAASDADTIGSGDNHGEENGMIAAGEEEEDDPSEDEDPIEDPAGGNF